MAPSSLPPGATDCHLHAFGPEAKYPFQARGRFPDPPEARPEAIATLLGQLGLSRAVLVQTGIYGTDNTCQLDAALELPISTRVVVVVARDVGSEELARLHAAGARGVRIVPGKSGAVAFDDLEHISSRVAPLGWHVELLLKPGDLPDLESRLACLPCPVVLDHFAALDPQEGLAQPVFTALLRLLERGQCWVKLSAPDIVSREPWPHPSLRPFAHALVQARPDRLIWGSDWPHAGSGPTPPDTMAVLDLLHDWAPHSADHTAILVANPATLYGFDS
jgi:predicted TIM-barrel fold metal-dependent hydrolase